ncbi:hypothetical protein QJQ45_011910 [Haematococcus lacustris]|nr:hypothetical protein QJQ45_011910 [Haematococcus lacustris]
MSLVAQCLRGSGPVPRSKIRFRLKTRENKSGELRAAHIAAVHASAGPRTPPAKQREERRAEWNTQRRQVIKVPGDAVLRGCKKTRRKLMAHFQLRAGVHSQLRVIARAAVQPCIGESRWRPLELCYWPEQGALPAKGKEYPGLGYKRLRDKPPKAQQQQAPPI